MSELVGKTVTYMKRRAVVLQQDVNSARQSNTVKLRYEDTSEIGYAPTGLVKPVEESQETALAIPGVEDVEVVIMMTADEARDVVQQINSHLNSARKLLLDLHERRGWEALGYASWRDCATAEFGESQTRVYQLLSAAKIEKEISTIVEISEDSPMGEIPESHLRPLAQLNTANQRNKAWQQAVETAPNGKVTAKHVQSVVDQMTPSKPRRNPRFDPDAKAPMAAQNEPQDDVSAQDTQTSTDPVEKSNSGEFDRLTIWNAALVKLGELLAVLDVMFENGNDQYVQQQIVASLETLQWQIGHTMKTPIVDYDMTEDQIPF